MSTSVRVGILGWLPRSDEPTTSTRPRFVNPVPAAVTAGGRFVGELDAHLHWEENDLVARLALPALPGHTMRASCAPQQRDGGEDAAGLWIDSIDVTIDHDDTATYRSFEMDAPPIPSQRARVLQERKASEE